MARTPSSTSARPARSAAAVTTWDGVVSFWVVFWLVVGVTTGYLIWQLTGLSAGVVDAGQALNTAGRALQDLSGTPVIGERTGELGNRIMETATSVRAGGASATTSLRGLAVVIGIAVGLGPLSPVLVIYLPRRLAWRREVREVSAVLAGPATSATQDAAVEILARRAVHNLGLRDLLAVTPDPEGDLAAGRCRSLARAELGRLGLATPASWL
ncbi:hypothetical protein GCM10023258_26050 [Terrabacter aeriphilus]|uniref:Uncharacterized protein n=1 Tax=Terrabacter aeriphilus TaxID=515662 RepID=A0ABP9JGT3_9MICO